MTALRVYAGFIGVFMAIACLMMRPEIRRAATKRERRREIFVAAFAAGIAFAGIWLAIFGRVVP